MTLRAAALLPAGRGLSSVVAAVGRPHSLALLLLAGALALIAANVVLGLAQLATGDRPGGELARAVDVGTERNLPTVYGTMLLLVASLLLARVAARRLCAPVGADAASDGARDARYWVALAIGFAFLAVDETVMLHARLLPPLIGDPQLGGAFRHAWVIPALALLVPAALAFRPFLRRLPVTTRAAFVLAGLVYVGGAIGGEMAGGLARELAGRGILSSSAVLAEEGLELLGVALFIHALLSMPRERAPEPR